MPAHVVSALTWGDHGGMSHELSRADVIALASQKGRQYQVSAQVTVVVHDFDALRAAARRAFDHGRFASEQERAAAWAAIKDDPARLISQAIDFARLTEDIPGLLPHSADWTVGKAS